MSDKQSGGSIGINLFLILGLAGAIICNLQQNEKIAALEKRMDKVDPPKVEEVKP